MKICIEGITFSSEFDSGNLSSVKAVTPDSFQLTSQPDAAETLYATNYTTWFHFSMTGAALNQNITLSMCNSNKQSNLYYHDYRPVFKSIPSQPTWSRLRTSMTTTVDKDTGKNVLTWTHKFPSVEGETVFFAFCYAYPLETVKHKFDSFFEMHGLADDLALSNQCSDEPGIYLHREWLTSSLEGRPVELITVSSRRGITAAREPWLDGPGLFPAREMPGRPPTVRPFAFDGSKETVFVSCRVHPGETPGQWIFDGFFDFVVKEGDPRSDLLRDRFVFKFIPILNPDGVYKGFYRTDTRGANLNRFYLDPNPATEPTIFAAKAVVLQCHALGRLALYLDCHAHVNKRGVFFYGNHLPSLEEQVSNTLYARLVALNSPYLEEDACCFAASNMTAKDKRDGLSKEGCGRVAVYQATSIIHCYTVEANYNCCRQAHSTVGASGDHGGRATPPRSPAYSCKIGPAEWEDTGKACAIALLDMRDINPWSRLRSSTYKSIETARLSLKTRLSSESAYVEEGKDWRRRRSAERRKASLTGALAAAPALVAEKIPLSGKTDAVKLPDIPLSARKSRSIGADPTSARLKAPGGLRTRSVKSAGQAVDPAKGLVDGLAYAKDLRHGFPGRKLPPRASHVPKASLASKVASKVVGL